jgi:hypothetical protein
VSRVSLDQEIEIVGDYGAFCQNLVHKTLQKELLEGASSNFRDLTWKVGL